MARIDQTGAPVASVGALPEKLEREVSRCCKGKHAKQRG
jgi:hypothetical protein